MTIILRYYWEDENLIFRIVETSLTYGYEYFGSYERLVLTELTEKCYKVLAVALHQIKGGSVEGSVTQFFLSDYFVFD